MSFGSAMAPSVPKFPLGCASSSALAWARNAKRLAYSRFSRSGGDFSAFLRLMAPVARSPPIATDDAGEHPLFAFDIFNG
jgi:hypothetical protein